MDNELSNFNSEGKKAFLFFKKWTKCSNFEMTKAQVYGFPLHSILQVCIFYKEYYAVSLLPLSHEITD